MKPGKQPTRDPRQATPLLPAPRAVRRHPIRRILLLGGLALLLVFWLAALPLPGPLDRARQGWWQHSAERRANIDYQEAHGWPEDAARAPVHGTLHLQPLDGKQSQDQDQAQTKDRNRRPGQHQNQATAPLDFTATACDSGQRRLFYGVTLTNPKQPTLSVRVVLPETGSPHLTLTQAGHDDLVVNQPDCPAWNVTVDPGNSLYNTIRSLQGHAYLTCTTPTTTLTAHLDFRNCH